VRRVTLAVTAALALLLPAAAQAHDGLPLGSPSLRETRTTQRLAPGVRYTKIVRGTLSRRDGWTVDVAIVDTRAEARDLARRLREAGYSARVETLERPPDDRRPGPLGYRVHSGLFDAKAEADERAAQLRAAGLPVRGAVFTAEDGERTSGPWVVHVLRVDPDAYAGRISPVLSNDVVVGREPLSSIAARTGALAGVKRRVLRDRRRRRHPGRSRGQLDPRRAPRLRGRRRPHRPAPAGQRPGRRRAV
jgi:hypothetical protein